MQKNLKTPSFQFFIIGPPATISFIFIAATFGGHEEVVEILLNTGAKTDAHALTIALERPASSV